MFHVYVLRSKKTGRRYVGSCEDINHRIDQHNAGASKATRHGVPWVLIHAESFRTVGEKNETCGQDDFVARRQRAPGNRRTRMVLCRDGYVDRAFAEKKFLRKIRTMRRFS